MVPSLLADQEPGSRGRAAIAACPGLRRKTEQNLVRASSSCHNQVPDGEAEPLKWYILTVLGAEV